MSEPAQPPAPFEGGEGAASENDNQSDDAAAAETMPIPGFDLDALRGWMLFGSLDDEDDADVSIELGRDALDTIPLPPDELERLLVLTRGRFALEDIDDGDAPRGRKDRLVTLLSAQADGPFRATPVPATPRTMRGVEILLGTAVDYDDDADRAVTKRRGARRRKTSRWTVAAIALAAALLPAVAFGVRANLFPGRAQATENMSALSALSVEEGSDRAVNEGRTVDDKGAAFADARAALTRLRAGVLSCARETIGVLPGTSPPVPASLRLAKGEGYASSANDWGTPVWSCAAFNVPAPQRFQIQWQMLKTNVEGMGVAWIDEDEDGVPDRALGFRASLKDKGQAEAGEIEVVDPELPVARIAR